MALPTGIFHHSASGRLQVTFYGQWAKNDGHDWGDGATDLWLRAFVDSGTVRRTAVLSLNSTTAVLEIPYTGGTNVAVGMELITYALSGPAAVYASHLECVCRLFGP